MKHLVENMLVLAKSDNAEKQPHRSTVDFGYTVKSAILVYEPICVVLPLAFKAPNFTLYAHSIPSAGQAPLRRRRNQNC